MAGEITLEFTFLFLRPLNLRKEKEDEGGEVEEDVEEVIEEEEDKHDVQV